MTLIKGPFDSAIEEGQRCLKASPVVVLGSGASVPYGLPSMTALAEHLKVSIRANDLTPSEQALWAQFSALLDTKDLESALHALTLNEKISDQIAEKTWELINAADAAVLSKLLEDENHLPLTRLYRHLFNSTNRTISVVTTNYDRLAEYAADLAGFHHNTGFSYGYLRHRQAGPRLSLRQETQTVRTVDIWKVHGCLDWFTNQQDQVVALTSAHSIPAHRRPAIVTPGIAKYARTHLEPFRSIIAGADSALERATAYLCIGFGFNDLHIQPKLLERWKRGDAALVILTKTLTDSAKKMLNGAKEQRYLAFEESGSGTNMWSHFQPTGVHLDGVHLWKLSNFLDVTT